MVSSSFYISLGDKKCMSCIRFVLLVRVGIDVDMKFAIPMRL